MHPACHWKIYYYLDANRLPYQTNCEFEDA